VPHCVSVFEPCQEVGHELAGVDGIGPLLVKFLKSRTASVGFRRHLILEPTSLLDISVV